MAQKVVVELLDDTDGSPAEETISFALDGLTMEIDLSGPNADALRETLAPWMQHARRVGGRSVRSGSTRPVRPVTARHTSDVDLNDLRIWARANGYQVSDRGRISAQVMEAYKNRGQATTPEPVEQAQEAAVGAEQPVEGVKATPPAATFSAAEEAPVAKKRTSRRRASIIPE